PPRRERAHDRRVLPLRRVRAAILAELMCLAERRRAHRRRMNIAIAVAVIGQVARVGRTFGDGSPPLAWWPTFVLALVAFVFAAHELRCVRALDRQMGALDKVITPRR